jgi:hypothetical protein
VRLLRVGILGALSTLSFIFWIRLYSLDQVLSKLNQLPEVCPLRRIVHLKCAFCGMTHAWIHLFFGDWKGAIRENLFSIPLFLVFIGMLGVWIWGKSDLIPEEKRKTLGGMSLLLLCAYTLVRNLNL